MWKTVLLTWIVGEYVWKVAGLFCVDVPVLWNELCSFNRVKSTHNWKESEYKCKDYAWAFPCRSFPVRHLPVSPKLILWVI